MNLAAELLAADVASEAAKNKLEGMLYVLFPGWQSWEHLKPYGLAVYGAFESATAAAKLHAVGFETVILHDHRVHERTVTCRCRVFEDS